jgi:hypothetical protein
MSAATGVSAKPAEAPQSHPVSPAPGVAAPSLAEQLCSLLRLLWSERMTLIVCTAVACAISVAAAFLVPARYESMTRILPAPPSLLDSSLQMMRPEAGALAGLAGLGDLSGGNDRFVTYCRAVSSPTASSSASDS